MGSMPARVPRLRRCRQVSSAWPPLTPTTSRRTSRPAIASPLDKGRGAATEAAAGARVASSMASSEKSARPRGGTGQDWREGAGRA